MNPAPQTIRGRAAHAGFSRLGGLCLLLASASLFSGCASPPVPTEARAVSLASASCAKPAYPVAAKRDGAQGATELQFEVDALGKVTRLAILKPSGASEGHRALDVAAMELVKQCSFPPTPGFLPGTGTISYVWKLED